MPPIVSAIVAPVCLMVALILYIYIMKGNSRMTIYCNCTLAKLRLADRFRWREYTGEEPPEADSTIDVLTDKAWSPLRIQYQGSRTFERLGETHTIIVWRYTPTFDIIEKVFN